MGAPGVALLKRVNWPIIYVALTAALLFDFMKCPIDEEIGNVEDANSAALVERLEEKSALIVGGTKGIGRGVAVALARAGANVEIVGHPVDDGNTLVRILRKLAYRPSQQVFGSYSADFSTVEGCLNFTRKLKEDVTSFDYVVFTEGAWPDRANPTTADGIDKVIAMELLTRFVLVREAMASLTKRARIMSVSRSTFRFPFPAIDDVKAIISGERQSYWLLQMMFSAGIAADTFLMQAAKRFPSKRFIGVHPGIVPTDHFINYNSMPSWLGDTLKGLIRMLAMTPLPNFFSEEACGEMLVRILTSPNVEKRGTTFFNYLLESRKANEASYEEEFGNWLWKFLETTTNRLRKVPLPEFLAS